MKTESSGGKKNEKTMAEIFEKGEAFIFQLIPTSTM